MLGFVSTYHNISGKCPQLNAIVKNNATELVEYHYALL